MKKLLLCLLSGVDIGITISPANAAFSIRSRVGRIRRQSAAQLRPRLLVAIAVDTADVAAVDVRDVVARSKRLVVVHARKVEKYNRLFCYHSCKGRYFLRRRANRLKN